MNEDCSEVLYYPNLHPENLAGIKQSLLLYDRVHVIAPLTTPLMGCVLSDSDCTELDAIERHGALGESWALPSAQAVAIHSDVEIMRKRREEFLIAISEDLADPDVRQWESAWKVRHGGRDVSWFILPNYFDGNPPDINDANYRIERVRTNSFGELFRVPFLVGMSLGLSESLWAAVDGGWTLFTDDQASEEFLMLRLARGWKRLSTDPEIRSRFGIEHDFAAAYASARLGSRIIGMRMPELIREVADKPILEIVHMREESDQKDALKAFRSGLAELVQSDSLWKSRNFKDFENEAYAIYNQQVLPAFNALDKTHFTSAGDLFATVDVGEAVGEAIKSVPEAIRSASEAIKSAPDLFMRAAVPAAAAGAAAGLSAGVAAVTPVVLLAFGSGLAASFVAELIKHKLDQLQRRRSAQYLTYPLNLRKVLNKVSRVPQPKGS